MSRTMRAGWPVAALAALAVLHVIAATALGVVLPGVLDRLALEVPWPIGDTVVPGPLAPLVIAVAVSSLGLLAAGLVALHRVRRLQPGTEGRLRWIVLASVSIVHAVTLVPALLIGRMAIRRVIDTGFGMVHPSQLLMAVPPGVEPLFTVLAALALSSLVVLALTELTCWFLLPERARRVAFAVLDVALLAAFMVVTWVFSLEPPEDDPGALAGSALRLGVTALLGVRLFIRLLNPLLGLVERAGFQSLVAARHLRAKKSSFLAAIGMLSVMAVAFSSCSLTTTLSVMGGFRQDLKEKILGNHAHVVVDREHGTFEGWDATLAQIRSVPDVGAAAPFATGEVMVSSASNLAGAVLRGVVPGQVGNVLDLEENIVCPSSGRRALEYLENPEQLLDLPAKDRRCGEESLTTTSLSPSDVTTEDEPPPDPSSAGLLEQLPGPNPSEPGAPDEPEAVEEEEKDVLPGIIVGQELARTLRLYVGDEVNVVSPFGELGPTGPMPKSRPFRVAGIFYSGMYEYDMKYAYTTLPISQRFLNVGDAISGVEVTVRDIDRAPRVAASIRQAIDRPELRVQDWQALNKNLFGALALEKLAMFVTLGIAILVAGFCVFGTLTLMVQEKAREVGILKAMGSSSRTIVGVFLAEGLLIGAFGASLGLGLGFLVGFAAKHFRIVPINPEVYYIDKLPVHMDPLDFTLVGIASILVCLAATVFPAVLASRLRPVEALRYD